MSTHARPEGLVLVRQQQGPFSAWWEWTCDVHSCDAQVYERHGKTRFWVTSQYAADNHARKHHHRHVCHDLSKSIADDD